VSPHDAQLGATLRALTHLRAGLDPREVLLDGLLARSGASLAAWIPAGDESGPLIRRSGPQGPGAVLELPRQLPWPVLLSLAPASSRRLDRHWLAQWPGPRALGLEEALAGRSAEGARLWIESSRPLGLRQHEFRDWLRSLAEFEVLDREGRERATAETLVRRGAAAAGVAHDLRNQLSLAALELERLRELGDVRAGGEALARTLHEAQALSHSFLSRDGHGRATKALRGLLEEELRASIELVGRPGVRARLKCARGLATEVDQVLLRRVVRNLLLNALHATDDGGSVQLSAEALDDQRVEVTVEDDGRGMDERQLERWMRAGSSGRGSTGFGTTSVLDCVREIGAQLSIESTVGDGTRCVISLPRAVTGDRAAVIICDADPIRRRRIVRRVEGLRTRAAGVVDAMRGRAFFETYGALGLVIARGMLDDESAALRNTLRSAGLPIVESSVLRDEFRAVGELCHRLRDHTALDSGSTGATTA
jgi:signal transduction histidine kinase